MKTKIKYSDKFIIGVVHGGLVDQQPSFQKMFGILMNHKQDSLKNRSFYNPGCDTFS
jgi:hypothetical protein